MLYGLEIQVRWMRSKQSNGLICDIILDQGNLSSPSLLLRAVRPPYACGIGVGSSKRIVVLLGGVSCPMLDSTVGAGVIPFDPRGTAGGNRETRSVPTMLVLS